MLRAKLNLSIFFGILLHVYTSIVAMSQESMPLQPLPCACATLRRASRALSQGYEEALRPVGLRATQFTILQTLDMAREVTQRRLGQILALDSTTLTRTLRIMTRAGWIAERRGTDRRERLLSLSAEGRSVFDTARPHWEKAQAEMRQRLGEALWNQIFSVADKVTASAI
jgi:DNA-binding MarR family transcriptional regulator